MSQMTKGNVYSPEDLAYAMPGGLASLATDGRWQYADHLKYLEDLLISVNNGELDRLIINMPPRHGKSMFTSHYFPAWYLGRNPDKKVILASYESTFAASWGAAARDVLMEYGNSVFNISVADDTTVRGLTSFMNTLASRGTSPTSSS